MNERLRSGPLTTALAALAAIVAIGVIACDEPRSSLRPSASLLDVQFTQQPTRDPVSSEEPSSAAPTFLSLPVGWDNTFCAVFADAVVAQELVIDIERALDEQNLRDARGLARELREITTDASTLLADLADWDPGAPAALELAALIDLGGRAGVEYGTFFTDESRAALRRARSLRREIGDATPAANAEFAALAELGITCNGTALVLEEF